MVVSYVGLAGGGGSFGRMLRIGRILRPLRMINRNEGLKVIVDALLRAAVPVTYTLVLLLAYFFSFGVLGMEFFLGAFYRCNDPLATDKQTCVGHFRAAAPAGSSLSVGLLQPRVWHNPPFSFDSIGEALSTLFETIALKAWPEKLWVAMDVAGPGEWTTTTTRE